MRNTLLFLASVSLVVSCSSTEPEQVKQEVVPTPELVAPAAAPAPEAAPAEAAVPTDLGGIQAPVAAQVPATEATSSAPAEIQAAAPEVAPAVEATPVVEDPNKLTMISRRADEAPATAPYVAYGLQVTSNGLNVRSEPSARSKIVRTLPKGSRVKGTGREGIWVQIGTDEYVSIIYLKEIAPLKETEDLGAAR